MNLHELLSSTQTRLADSYDSGVSRALHRLGLQRKVEKSSELPVLAALFSAGLVTGVALSLLFAPKPGSEVRRSVRRALPFPDGDDEYEDYELPRYDFENDRFRNIRRPRRSHRGQY